MDVREILQKLPVDIVRYIIPFTYSCQSPELLKDIRSFYSSRKYICEWYYELFHVLQNNSTEFEDQEWLINDLFGFANRGHALMFGYIDDFYLLFFRNFSLCCKKKVEKFISVIEGKSLSTQINIFWGIFTPEERTSFIKFTKKIYD
jgi:hypothetical protein